MQTQHYLLIIIALIAGYFLASIWPAPGHMVKQALSGG